MAFDQSEVGSGLIDLAQCERAFVWHAHVMLDENCSIVTTVAPTRFAFSPTRSFARGVTLVGMSAKKIRRVNQVSRGRSG
jgi:hypothetical protein